MGGHEVKIPQKRNPCKASYCHFRQRSILYFLTEFFTFLNVLGIILFTGREKGYKHAQISVMMGNTSAQRAYEQIGFKEYNTVTSPLIGQYLDIKGVINMRMDL